MKPWKEKFTVAEKKYINMIGEADCIEAFSRHESGNGGNTIGEEYLSRFVKPSNYTKGGDCIVNAGRKLWKQNLINNDPNNPV